MDCLIKLLKYNKNRLAFGIYRRIFYTKFVKQSEELRFEGENLKITLRNMIPLIMRRFVNFNMCKQKESINQHAHGECEALV